MSDQKKRWWPIGMLVAAVIAALAVGVTTADDEKAEPKATAAKTDATAKPADSTAAAADAEDEKVDPFAVPDGTVEELIDYMRGLSQQRPLERSREALIEHLHKVSQAMVEACDKVLAKTDLSDDVYVAIAKQKLEALNMLVRLEAENAVANLRRVASEFSQSDKTEVAQAAKFQLIVLDLQSLDASNTAATTALIDKVDQYLADGPLTNNHYSVAMSLAQQLELEGQTELAALAYKKFGTRLAASDNAEIAARGEIMLGSARRLNLVGNSVDISGTLVDGKEFDWSKYRGKVVLVDFWATWCGPCRAELPNVLENYEKYHDRGFEVVGISLDDDRSALESFLEEQKIPWETLFSDDPNGAVNKLASYYGVSAIPTVWLIDQQGKVVSLMARGPALGELLGEMLGEPAETADAKPQAAKES
ncbi:MAG: redoxin family protein [Pirellulales bacterium]|nr:redoxin domain-containing protein [Planctomycetales bacterium]